MSGLLPTSRFVKTKRPNRGALDLMLKAGVAAEPCIAICFRQAKTFSS